MPNGRHIECVCRGCGFVMSCDDNCDIGAPTYAPHTDQIAGRYVAAPVEASAGGSIFSRGEASYTKALALCFYCRVPGAGELARWRGQGPRI